MTGPDKAFESVRDAELGAALRVALEGDEHQAFITRVLAHYDRAHSWGVLAGWARWGIAAAVATALLAGTATVPALKATAGLDDYLPGAISLPETGLLAAERPPDPGALLTPTFDR